MKKNNHIVVFFCDLPHEISPSVWVNATQLIPWLASNNWDLQIFPAISPRLYKVINHVGGIGRIYYKRILKRKRLEQIEYARKKADVVIVHKSMMRLNDPPELEEILRENHKRIVYNYDDAVNLKGIGYLDKRVQLADLVWVGNENLYNYSKKYNSNALIIESAVDTNHFSQKNSFKLNNPPNLVWSGTPFSHQYLNILEKPLKLLASKKKIKMNLISKKEYIFKQSDFEVNWVKYNRQVELKYLRQSDIGVMPISDGEYERSKENYKVKMYMSSGLPVVCSAVGINKKFIDNSITGFLVDTDDEWVNAMLEIIENEKYRTMLGRNAREFILNNYSIDVIGKKIIDMFESL